MSQTNVREIATTDGKGLFQPLTIAECHEFFDPMKPVLDAHQMLIGEVNGQTAGFCLGMPDWTPLFRSFKGKVGLPQVIRLMLTAGRYQRAGLLAVGALPAYRGAGLAHALAVALYRRYEDRGFKEAFYYPVNEDACVGALLRQAAWLSGVQ